MFSPEVDPDGVEVRVAADRDLLDEQRRHAGPGEGGLVELPAEAYAARPTGRGPVGAGGPAAGCERLVACVPGAGEVAWAGGQAEEPELGDQVRGARPERKGGPVRQSAARVPDSRAQRSAKSARPLPHRASAVR